MSQQRGSSRRRHRSEAPRTRSDASPPRAQRAPSARRRWSWQDVTRRALPRKEGTAAQSAARGGTYFTGALSLMESQVELRFLPFRKTFGFAGFVDAGAAGPDLNPFEDGVSLAAGFGPRLRLWYVPIALDLSYRILHESELENGKPFDPYFVFVRIGEAF